MSALRRANPRTGEVVLIDQGPWKGSIRPGQSLAGYRITAADNEDAQRWRERDERIRRQQAAAEDWA